MPAIIEVENLEKTFGSVTAARDISLSIPAGQTVGIIGANGAGKTTFVNMVTGYLKPSKGRIVFEGQDITRLSSREITHLGICRSFQIAQVFSSLTTFENIITAVGLADRFAGRSGFLEPLYTPARAEIARGLLQHYNMDRFADMPASALPQGVRKILDIVMAVASGPRVVLLDEPTSGVSVEEKFAMMEAIIHALKRSEITILFVEHDMEIVSRYADRVLAFYDGTVIADGPPSEALADNQVREFIIGETLHRPSRESERLSHVTG